ncbi:MAG: S-layer homology domain-containing protein [Clostridiales bacterium]|nr:S-layer homology domain-containing protein [Clostridiales bacterium]
MKKTYTLALAAALCLQMSTMGFAANFADIKDVPWPGAADYINKAADAGLLTGSKNDAGQLVFRAKDQVTYCETAQLIYNLMKSFDSSLASADYTSKWSGVMNGYKIPSWAQKAVSLGLEKGYLASGDLSKFMTSSGGNNYAKREDVAVIFGKALSPIFKDVQTSSLTYADASSVSSGAQKYVSLLNKLGLMVGDSANKFNPQNPINRAEMAVLTVKTNDKLASEKNSGSATNVTGTITEDGGVFGSKQIFKINANGSVTSYFVDASTKVTIGGSSASYKDLSVGDVITFSYTGNTITAISVQNSANNSVKGVIKGLSDTRIILDDDKEYYFQSGKNPTVKFNGSSADINTLLKYFDDDFDIEVTMKVDSSNYVISIDASTESSTGVYDGEVESLSERSIKIKNDGKTYTYKIDDVDDVDCELNDEECKFSDLEKEFEDTGITVKLSVDDDDYVTKIVAESDEEAKLKGKITSLSSKSIKIKSSANSKTYEYDLPKDEGDLTIKIDGKTKDLDDLKEAYKDEDDIEVTLELDDDEEYVEVITAKTDVDSDDDELKGTISNLSNSEIKIKSGSKTYTYDLPSDKDDLSIKIDGKSKDFDDLKEVYDDETVKVELTVKDDEVTKIVATTDDDDDDEDDASGKVTFLSNIKITIESGSKEKTYRFKDDDVEEATIKINGKNAEYDDLYDYYEDDADIEVELTLNSDDEVTKVVAETKGSNGKSGSVKSVTSNMITIKSGSDTERYSIVEDEDDLTVKIDGKTKTLKDLIELYQDDEDIDVDLTLEDGVVVKIEAEVN